nr:site-specific integrase [Sphingopyxis sp. C-1]
MYRDTVITGFAFEVRSSGGATYYFIYSDAYGKLQTTKIARFGDITFEQARKVAKRRLSEVTLGGDPAAKKKEVKSIPTYADLAAQHLDHAKTYQRRPSNTESVLRVHLIPKWGTYRLHEITTQAISKWFADKIAEGLAPATIEKIRVIFSRSFELGRQWNIAGADPNPVRNVPRRRFKNARTKFLSAVEAKRLLAEAEKSANPQLKNIIGLLLLTGARKTELLTAQWQHIDLERRTWHIPTTKTGVPRYVPLSQAAMDIIEALPKFDGCPWLLPNPAKLKPYYDLKRPWDTARDAAGLADLHIHDLRHSAASFMINAGIDLFAVGRILGHADHQSTMRYSHLANDTLMAAVEAGAKQMQL